MKRNVSDTLAAVSLLLTLTGVTFGQSLPQPLMPSSARAKEDRYVGQFAWPQFLPRLNGDNEGDGSVAPYPTTVEGSKVDAAVGSYRVQRRKTKRYKLSFYDCIALYCQDQHGDDRNNCILNSCNRSRYWPRN